MKNAKENVRIAISTYSTNSSFSISEWLKARELCKKDGTKENKLYQSLRESHLKEKE